jgi:hypothetical protein
MLSRKSFFESIIAGCIPVVLFRNDDAFLAQFLFSLTVPYRTLWFTSPKSVLSTENVTQKAKTRPGA